MPEAPQPICSRRRSRCLCTGRGLPSAHGTFTRAAHTHTVETLGEHIPTMLLIKRSSFLRQVFPPSYLNRKYFFILDLPESPKKYNPSRSRWVRAAPAQKRARSWGAGLCGGGLSVDWAPSLCPFWHILPRVQVSCAKWPVIGRLVGLNDHFPLPSCSHPESTPPPTSPPPSDPLAYLAGSTAQWEQGNGQHQHCQHFEPYLLRIARTLPTSSPYPLPRRAVG